MCAWSECTRRVPWHRTALHHDRQPHHRALTPFRPLMRQGRDPPDKHDEGVSLTLNGAMRDLQGVGTIVPPLQLGGKQQRNKKLIEDTQRRTIFFLFIQEFRKKNRRWIQKPYDAHSLIPHTPTPHTEALGEGGG